jgi:dihydrofolate synthase/folylpolyglutamate synthase
VPISYLSSIEYLESLYRTPHVPAERAELRRAQTLLDRLGSPHLAFRSVHVAGSTGKGSTTSMVGSILRAGGHTTGLFRSPHLSTYRERIAIGDALISEDCWTDIFGRVVPVVEAMRRSELPGYELGRPTLFEVLFAMACLYFQREGVEWAAMETGLGGRLDATNLLQSDVAVITNISLEHTQILGSSIGEIAREKAAIIKTGSTSVAGSTKPDALRVIEDRARGVGSRLLTLGRDVQVEMCSPHGQFASQRIRLLHGAQAVDVDLPLAGAHQATNAGVAWGAAVALRERGVCLEDGAVQEGLRDVRVPGRLEVFPGEPDVVLDGAHNPAGVEALASALAAAPPRPTTLLFGAMDDKDVESMAAIIAPAVAKVVLCPVPGTHRAASIARLGRAFELVGHQAEMAETIEQGLGRARDITPSDGRIVIAGSLYIVGALRPIMAQVAV